MNTPLDLAISAAAGAEGTYSADLQNVSNIQTAIETATAPLAPAQAQLSTDAVAFNKALDDLAAAATAAKVTVAETPAPPAA